MSAGSWQAPVQPADAAVSPGGGGDAARAGEKQAGASLDSELMGRLRTSSTAWAVSFTEQTGWGADDSGANTPLTHVWPLRSQQARDESSLDDTVPGTEGGLAG